MNDAELSCAVAQEAGQLLLALREQAGPLADRSAADALRDRADQASHELISAALGEHRPDDAVLSEEGKDDAARLSADRVWIVDPLDGTWEYGQGRADFAVHVALWIPQAQEVMAATVDLPAQGVTRTMDDPRTGPAALPTDRPLRLVASRSRPPVSLPKVVEQLGIIVREAGVNPFGVELVDVGSVGAKVNEIVAGRAEAYMHDTGFYEWDVAAPLGVAQHLGFDATHVDGSAVTFNHMPPYVTDLIVARPDISEAVRQALVEASAS